MTDEKLYKGEELNIITYNIRYDTWFDIFHPWRSRKKNVVDHILSMQCQIIGIQEALPHQLEYLQENMKGFAYVGSGRRGNEKSEFTPIFYDLHRIELLQSKTFWLSEHPEVTGSLGWDAVIPRIVTWAMFRDNLTSKEFFVFNTHFANRGRIAKRESAKLLLKKVKEIAGSGPCLIIGDFNSFPSEEPVQLMVDDCDPNHFIDAKTVSVKPHSGSEGTYTQFRSRAVDKEPIDFIFIKNGVSVLRHATRSETGKGILSSDHFAVTATVIIR